MASSSTLCPLFNFLSHHRTTKLRLVDHRFHLRHQNPLLKTSKSLSHHLQVGRGNNIVGDTRNWSGASIGDFNFDGNDDLDEEDDDDDDDEDRSLDLLIRFVQNVFRKISKRARKAVRSVLPISISSRLVGFSVNGVIILAFFWILKAFLEVVCTLGSIVFVSILVIRGIWAGISYLQESNIQKGNGFQDDSSVWTGSQPAS